MRVKIALLITSLFVLNTATVFSCTEAPGEEYLYGVWEGESNETEVLFVFNSDRTCSLSFYSADNETEELTGTFETDFSKYPVPLSIRNIPRLNHGLYTIIEFTDNSTLTIADFSPRWRLRPISFQDNAVINLRRVQ